MCYILKPEHKYIILLLISTYIILKFKLLPKDEKYGSDNILCNYITIHGSGLSLETIYILNLSSGQ
jgi:hypothetical protein